MKCKSQFVLVLIVFALLGRTAVTAVNPSALKFAVASSASPSDWSEEPVEEDESLGDDKAFHEFPAFALPDTSPSLGEIPISYALLDHHQEIVVPPPQG